MNVRDTASPEPQASACADAGHYGSAEDCQSRAVLSPVFSALGSPKPNRREDTPALTIAE